MKEKQIKKISLNLDLFYRLGAVIVGIMLSISLTRNILIISTANKKIAKVKDEIISLKEKNETLKKQIQESQTDEFTERQARNRLGLVREGEVVVVLPEEEILKKFSPKIEEQENQLPDPNWKKWLKLFL